MEHKHRSIYAALEEIEAQEDALNQQAALTLYQHQAFLKRVQHQQQDFDRRKHILLEQLKS